MDIHVANNKEYAELRSLWCQTFGDDSDFVDEFYDVLNAVGYVIVDDDHVRSCLTLFQAGTFNEKNVWVSYAICTEPKYRGNNFASALTEYVRDIVAKKGGVSIVCPAELSLIPFYEKIGFKPYFYSKNCYAEVSDDVSVETSALSISDYMKWREEFLADIPHVAVNERLLEFAEWDSSVLQPMLLINNGDAICFVESVDDGMLSASELIVNPKLLAYSKDISFQIAQGLAKSFEVDNVVFHTVTESRYIEKMQGMIADEAAEINDNLTMPYFGFPLK